MIVTCLALKSPSAETLLMTMLVPHALSLSSKECQYIFLYLMYLEIYPLLLLIHLLYSYLNICSVESQDIVSSHATKIVPTC